MSVVITAIPPARTNAAVEEDCTSAIVALSQGFLMTQIRLVLMLYFFMVAHEAACQTLSKAFLKSMKAW